MLSVTDGERGLYGLRAGESMPLPNKADAAWVRLEELREQARGLGIEVDDRWPIARIEQEIAARNT